MGNRGREGPRGLRERPRASESRAQGDRNAQNAAAGRQNAPALTGQQHRPNIAESSPPWATPTKQIWANS